MKIYCVELINYDADNIVVGYATTEEKAKQMIDLMVCLDGYDSYEYEYYWVYVDAIMVDNKKIEF